MILQYIVIGLFIGSLYATAEVNLIRGVDIKKQSFYNPAFDFTCLDGSKKIPFSSVNDNYCDCLDASDEPGTSACPEGRFFCQNLGHKPFYLQSSRVNDGLCDCCDGSDEYDSDVVCFNECDKHGKEELIRMEKLKEEHNVGLEVRNQYIKVGATRKEEKKARAETLNQLLEERRVKLEELKTLKETLEAPEKEAKDKHEKAWEEEKAKKQAEKELLECTEAFSLLDLDKNGWVSFAELMANPNMETDMSEDDAKILLGGEALVNFESFKALFVTIKPKFLKQGRLPSIPEAATETSESNESGGEANEGEAKNEQHEGVQEEDATTTPPPPPVEDGKSTWDAQLPPDIAEEVKGLPDKDRRHIIREYERHGEDGDDSDNDDDGDDDDDDDNELNGDRATPNKQNEQMPAYDEETKKLIEVADEARKTHSDAESEIRELESEQSTINDYLKINFGTEDEFSALKGDCFEFTDREYIYKLCPFEKVTQRPKDGGSETDLGRWGEWLTEGDFTKMKYDGGQGCWNGPARSTLVHMSCGRNNEVSSVSEPSRCEYKMDFKTPALCVGDVHPSRTHTEL